MAQTMVTRGIGEGGIVIERWCKNVFKKCGGFRGGLKEERGVACVSSLSSPPCVFGFSGDLESPIEILSGSERFQAVSSNLG